MVTKMENLKVLLKRGLEDGNDCLHSLYPPHKKRQRKIDIDHSISGLIVTSFLQNSRLPKLRLLSFKEGVGSLPKPIPKPNPNSQVFEKRILPLPLPLGKAADCPRRTNKASVSVSVKTKAKPSFRKQSPQIPDTISLDLDQVTEKRILALPLGKAATCPRRNTETSASVKTQRKAKPSFQKQSPQNPDIISLDVPLPTLPAKPPQNPTTTPLSELKEENLSFYKPTRTPIPEVSPRRALRAAELKTRFAATIFKARHHRLFDSAPADVATHRAEATAAVQLRRVQEKQREAARIREKQREAARIGLLKVEEAADGKDNMQMFKELEELCGGALDYPNGPYALHRFGLILKQ